MSILQGSLLESKMNSNYQDKIFALQKAETNLIAKEKQINPPNTLPSGVSEISSATCGVKFYRVEAAGQYKNTKTILQSTFAIIKDTDSCDPKPQVHNGRQSWREL